MIVSNYGLHNGGGIWFLHQQGKHVQNLISPNLPSPFEVRVQPRLAQCPHAINLSQTLDDLPSWLDEPLAQVMVPLPRRDADTAKLMHDPDGSLTARVAALCRLSTPTYSLLKPIWWQAPRARTELYRVSNLAPVVLTGARISDTANIEAHIEMARIYGRRLLILCQDRVPVFDFIEWINPFDVPEDAPFEAIGATAVRRFMEA